MQVPCLRDRLQIMMNSGMRSGKIINLVDLRNEIGTLVKIGEYLECRLMIIAFFYRFTRVIKVHFLASSIQNGEHGK